MGMHPSLSWSLERNRSNGSNVSSGTQHEGASLVFLFFLSVLRRDKMYREMSVRMSEHTGISYACFSPLLTNPGDPLKVIRGKKNCGLPPVAQALFILVMTAGHGHMEFSLARGFKARTLR